MYHFIVHYFRIFMRSSKPNLNEPRLIAEDEEMFVKIVKTKKSPRDVAEMQKL